jgi:pullulanase
MKKILVFLLIGLLTALLPHTVKASEPVTEVYIHYYRYQGDYSPWDIWIWRNQPTSEAGSAYSFSEDDTASIFNYGGVLAKVQLTGALAGTTRLGFIVRKPDWSEKDVDIDRFIDIPETVSGGILHVYLVEGDSRIGYSKDDPNGPNKDPKFRFAYFSEMDTIYFSATEAISLANLSITKDDVLVDIVSYTPTGSKGTIIIDDEIDFSKKYEIIGTFTGGFTSRFSITYDGIYDSDAFNDAFGYEGDDLGAIVSNNKTSFRLWAPISESVTLNLYSTGTPSNFGGSDVKLSTHEMNPSEKGTFLIEINQNLHGTYYTYSVTNGSNTYEVIDPYAKSSGINGIRGLVVDFSLTNPTGFVYGQRPNNMTSFTDAIIYELHVRDLTIHESWNGTEVNRGRYLGLTEKGTTYNGVTTGFDHIVELGVTHVQLLPFFDFGVLDESRINQEGYNSFNWGYMPINFNVLEGSYSRDPFDGLVRIQEMKTVIRDFSEANIRINMDVVYNHTGLTADSNFNLIVPGYYFRKTATGAFSNGSGTGNETASERFMMRKFMVESLIFWANEYNISGFRFDLMALHDVETMLQIESALNAIDETIMIYGEPWMGGSSPLPAADQAGKTNLHRIGDVGAFNDDLRDAVKGSVFNREDKGFIQGNFNTQIMTRMRYGILGGIAHESVTPTQLSNMRIWHTSPLKTINYVTAHDNNTLHDKLYLTLQAEKATHLIPRMIRQGNAIVLTSQGIAFLHAGDEFMRSKPAASGKGFDHNSYESPDSVNQLRWDHKARETEMVVFEYFKGLIELRKNHPSFRMTSATDITNNLSFVYQDISGVIAFELSNQASNDSLERILVIHNANRSRTRVELPKEGGWVLMVDGDKVDLEGIETFKGGQTIRVSANSTYVLYQDTSIPDVNYTPVIIISTLGGLSILGGGIYLVLKLKKAKNIIA